MIECGTVYSTRSQPVLFDVSIAEPYSSKGETKARLCGSGLMPLIECVTVSGKASDAVYSFSGARVLVLEATYRAGCQPGVYRDASRAHTVGLSLLTQPQWLLRCGFLGSGDGDQKGTGSGWK